MRLPPILLDLFCKAGGAGVGYARAGFEVVGVDIEPQPRYPFRFVQHDALAFLEKHGWYFDAIHASPPCQASSTTRNMPWTRASRGEVPCLIGPLRELLAATGKPYVIENVPDAPLVDAITLCGLMFGLKVFRHRRFESNVLLMQMPHPAHRGHRIGQGGFCCVAGHGDCNLDRRDKITGEVTPRQMIPADHRSVEAWRRAMGIDWMRKRELAEAIPPAYTEFVGWQLLRHVGHSEKQLFRSEQISDLSRFPI